MDKFLSGPPGGRTLPQTPTSLSELAGGVYGPGASVASTGLNVHRASIRAGISRASGETWDDILDYYLVGSLPRAAFQEADFLTSSTLTAVRPTSLSASGRSTIKEVSTLLLAESPRVAKVLVRFREISLLQGTILNRLPAKFGPAIPPILSTTNLHPPSGTTAYLTHMVPPVLGSLAVCTFEAKASKPILRQPRCGLSGAKVTLKRNL